MWCIPTPIWIVAEAQLLTATVSARFAAARSGIIIAVHVRQDKSDCDVSTTTLQAFTNIVAVVKQRAERQLVHQQQQLELVHLNSRLRLFLVCCLFLKWLWHAWYACWHWH